MNSKVRIFKAFAPEIFKNIKNYHYISWELPNSEAYLLL